RSGPGPAPCRLRCIPPGSSWPEESSPARDSASNRRCRGCWPQPGGCSH
ncbi:hypothetical protein PKCEKB_PKCEKB_00270, partial [Dysosmobacter welbionis]